MNLFSYKHSCFSQSTSCRNGLSSLSETNRIANSCCASTIFLALVTEFTAYYCNKRNPERTEFIHHRGISSVIELIKWQHCLYFYPDITSFRPDYVFNIPITLKENNVHDTEMSAFQLGITHLAFNLFILCPSGRGTCKGDIHKISFYGYLCRFLLSSCRLAAYRHNALYNPEAALNRH